MPVRKILALIFPLASLTCLAGGYLAAGQWLALPGLLVALLAWLLVWKWPFRWLPLAGLLLTVGLSAGGVFAGASPVLMILSVPFALAGWDLLLWNLALSASSPAAPSTLLARSHYISLAWAVGLGLLLALAGRLLRLQLPFGVLLFLVLLALLSLERLFHALGG